MNTQSRKMVMALLLAVALAALDTGTAATASATTLERMSVAKMTQNAQLVVRAQCLANSVAWDGGEIWTFTSFEVEDSWKGAPTGAAQQVTVRLLGGSAGNLTSTVSGVPRFRPGEGGILFLQPAARRFFHCELGAGNVSHSPRHAQSRGNRGAGYRDV